MTTTGPEEPKKGKLVKVLTPIFIIVVLIILIVVKNQNPEFPLGYIILIGAIVIIIGGIAFFGLELSDKFKKITNKISLKNNLPAPAETKVLWEEAKISLTNSLYRDHIKKYVQTINHSVGKNMKSLVVEFQVYSVYRPRELCSILINANYPKRTPTVIFNSDKKSYQLSRAIQSMSFDPEDPANEEETTIRNDLTGTVSTTKRKTYTKKDNINYNKEKEELI